MLYPRAELILKLVIEDYIRTAQPVGSKYLNEQYQLGVSDATVRGELAALEANGFLRAPHTSAGRVPTEAAYVYYLSYLRDKKFVLEDTPLRADSHEKDTQVVLKSMAKKLVEISGETAIVAIDPKWTYYTGVSNLFHKPDFQDPEVMQTLSSLVDQFDEVMQRMYRDLPEGPQVFIGSGNPFGQEMATILVRYNVDGETQGLLGLVGPLRMDYSRNLALIERAKEVIDEYFE
jgi:transcriptional regulator of heat shock response